MYLDLLFICIKVHLNKDLLEHICLKKSHHRITYRKIRSKAEKLKMSKYLKLHITCCCSSFPTLLFLVYACHIAFIKTSSQSSVDAITKIALEHNSNSNIVRTVGRASNQGHQTHQGVHFVRFSLRSVPVSRQSLRITYFNIRFSTASKANRKVKFHKYK